MYLEAHTRYSLCRCDSFFLLWKLFKGQHFLSNIRTRVLHHPNPLRSCAGSYESYTRYVSFEDTDPSSSAADDEVPIDLVNGGRQSWSNYANEKLNRKSTWLLFTIVSTIALVVLLLIVIFLRKRIRLSIALIVEGSR